MKSKTINTILLILVVALLAVLASFVRIRATADNVAVLRTAGMTCGNCATDIEKALQAKKGVAGVEVDTNGGWVVVGYDSKKIRPELIASTVVGLGYWSKVVESMSVERFRMINGREPGAKARAVGCGGGCGNGK